LPEASAPDASRNLFGQWAGERRPAGGGGAGGNRTPVRRVVTVRDTTIPGLRP